MWTLFERMLRSAPAEGSPAATPPTEPAPSPASTTPEPEGVGSLLAQAPAETPAEEKPAEPVAEEKVSIADLTLPENFQIPEETGTKLQEAIDKYGLKKEAVQDLVNLYAAEAQKAQTEAYAAYQQLNEQWVNEVKSDPELGGEKLDGNLAKIGKLLDNPAFVDPAFKAAMNLTGAGNHPAVLRTMLKIADALSEGGPVSGAAPSSARPATVAEALYPNLPKGY